MDMHGQELQQLEKANQLRQDANTRCRRQVPALQYQGALLGIAASKEAEAKLYRRKVLAAKTR